MQPAPMDPDDSIAYKELEERVAPARPSDTPGVARPEPLTAVPGTYEIVIGVFTAKSEAESSVKRLTTKGNSKEPFIKELSEKGFTIRVVEKPSSKLKFHVSAGPFKDKPSADNLLPYIRKNFNEQAWIDPPK
jgi:hypothetical protein